MPRSKVTVTPPAAVVHLVNAEPPPADVVAASIDPARQLSSPLVDRVYLGKILAKTIDADGKTLKKQMIGAGAKYAAGELAKATLSATSPGSRIDPAKFLQLCKRRGIKQTDIAGCLTVGKEAAGELLGSAELAQISVETPPREPSLNLDALDGLGTPALVEALEALLQDLRTQ